MIGDKSGEHERKGRIIMGREERAKKTEGNTLEWKMGSRKRNEKG